MDDMAPKEQSLQDGPQPLNLAGHLGRVASWRVKKVLEGESLTSANMGVGFHTGACMLPNTIGKHSVHGLHVLRIVSMGLGPRVGNHCQAQKYFFTDVLKK